MQGSHDKFTSSENGALCLDSGGVGLFEKKEDFYPGWWRQSDILVKKERRLLKSQQSLKCLGFFDREFGEFPRMFVRSQCVFSPPGGGRMPQHPEGVQLPLREEGAHLCEGQRGTADVLPEGERQTGVVHQRLVRHSATPSGGQLKTRCLNSQENRNEGEAKWTEWLFKSKQEDMTHTHTHQVHICFVLNGKRVHRFLSLLDLNRWK